MNGEERGASDAERKAFFQTARQQAEEDWRKNSKDANALTRWGGALLELANFMPGEKASQLVADAVEKFQNALEIDPKRHEALWCLGNAYTSQGFLSSHKGAATKLFAKAQDCFRDAVHEQPDNSVYKKGLEMTSKAPDLYDEIQKQMSPPSAVPRSGAGGFWWDTLGWVTVIGGLVAIAIMVSTQSQAVQKSLSAGTAPTK